MLRQESEGEVTQGETDVSTIVTESCPPDEKDGKSLSLTTEIIAENRTRISSGIHPDNSKIQCFQA